METMLLVKLKCLDVRVKSITKRVVKCPFLNSACRDSGSGGLGWGLGVFVINKLVGEADAGGLDHTLRNTALKEASQNFMCSQVTWNFIKT